MFTHEAAKRFADSQGCFVECGVAAGAQVMALAAGAPNKKIYALDSFEGIALSSNRDNQIPGIRMLSLDEQKALPNPGEQVLESSGATVVPVEDFWDHVHNALGPVTNIIAVKGWFELTLSTFDPGPISILRLDGDLYNSTWVCLQHLFPKVIKGGCVILDDFELKGCSDACHEYFDLIGYIPEYQYVSNIAYLFKH